MTYAKHSWKAVAGEHVPIDWCQFCGCVRFHKKIGFWGRVALQYVTPWNHPNGDKNKTVFDNEPYCVEIPIPLTQRNTSPGASITSTKTNL